MGSMGLRLKALAVLAILPASFDLGNALQDTEKERKMAVKLPPCAACTAVVESFEAGISRTSRGNFEGGDTAWEEKNLPNGYAKSELRFVEIQEKLCQGIGRGETQCHDNHHLWEDKLEEWWKLDEEQRPDLKQWLCVERVRACCPEDHFGAKCQLCLAKDSSGKICSGNGKCKGSGTRKGNGKCNCDKGYRGERCDDCSVRFFEAYRDDDKLLCSECHKSCEGHCTGSGPKSCVSCKQGYVMHTEQGCQDVDECQGGKKAACDPNQFCVNTEGSHQCFECDKACGSCFADGPDSCDECAAGYVLDEAKEDEGHGKGVCVSEETKANEVASEKQQSEEL